MRGSPGQVDAVLLATIAARVRLACRAQRRRQSLTLYRDALLRASAFLEHARTGHLLERDQQISVTPALDLAAEAYVRAAAGALYGADASTLRFSSLVRSLARTLRAAGRGGAIVSEEPWRLGRIEAFWGHIYAAAEQAAAAPTDEVEIHRCL